MGRPKKDPFLVKSVPLNFRVSSAVKSAIDAMVLRRAEETGDDSITGWFLAMVYREAKLADIEILATRETRRRRAAPKRSPTSVAS